MTTPPRSPFPVVSFIFPVWVAKQATGILLLRDVSWWSHGFGVCTVPGRAYGFLKDLKKFLLVHTAALFYRVLRIAATGGGQERIRGEKKKGEINTTVGFVGGGRAGGRDGMGGGGYPTTITSWHHHAADAGSTR